MVANGTDYPLIDGKVNGLACKFAPDTGAQITVVPDNLVFQDQVLEDTVVLRFGNGELERFPMAEVELQAESEPYRRKVAVAPVDMLRGTVLYSVLMDVAMAHKLLRDAAGVSLTMAGHSSDTPDISTSTQVDAGLAQGANEVINEALIAFPERTEELEVNCEWMASLAQQTEIERNRDLVPPVSLLADAPTVEQGISQQGPDEPVGLTGSQAGEANSVEAEVIVGNEYVTSGEEIELECLGCPTLVDESDVKLLKKEVMEDDSLKSCRELGDIKRNGYVWKDGLLFHEMVDETDQTLCRLVLPRPRRQKILRLAHDHSGHVGVKKVKASLEC